MSIPTVTDGLKAAQLAGVFAQTWREANRELLLERDLLNNGQFGFALGAAYNTVKQNLTAAKWAFAGAGGPGLVLDRYQI
ncbi:hypothetical protein [Ideonella sp. YS5]|uniref:hypothetical protein n=1 Tax=Ideonella sp. YS5 TaxID=3453714 RepID=UPI003EEECE11